MFLAEENPILPQPDELIIGAICFFIIFGIMAKVLVPKITKTLNERTDAIEGGLKRAETAQEEAKQTLEEYRAKRDESLHDAARRRQEAQEEGATIIAQLRQEGQQQRDAIVAAGHAQIDADRKQASAALRQDVGRLATELASRIVGESVQDVARQSRIIDRFLDELEERAESTDASREGVNR